MRTATKYSVTVHSAMRHARRETRESNRYSEELTETVRDELASCGLDAVVTLGEDERLRVTVISEGMMYTERRR